MEIEHSPGVVEKTQPSLDFNHILNSLQPQYVSVGIALNFVILCSYFDF